MWSRRRRRTPDAEGAAMQPILVAYGTTEGHTRKVAEFVAERLRMLGHRVDLIDTATPAAQQVLPFYQAAIIGGSVHNHRHQTALAHFVKANLTWLNVIPTAFFSVSLAMAKPDDEDRREAMRAANTFFDDAQWRPPTVHLIAGALKYTAYDFFKRYMVKSISGTLPDAGETSQDHEYTDWSDVDAFVDKFLSDAGIPAAARAT
jgi:menaquinone-dependent protoporphyrinogen oxidase